MKLITKTLIAGLILAGTISAMATPKATKTGFSDGGPAPMCWPGDPNCPPPIPSAK